MTNHDVCDLLDYHCWARDRVLDCAAALTAEQYDRELSSSFPSIRATLVHTYSAEWAWQSRLEGRSPTAHLALARFPDVASLRLAWVDTGGRMRALVASAGDAGVARRLDYRLLSGTPASSTLQQIVLHLVNHATYHRGQVATMLRQVGAQPAQSTDLIQFCRERDERTI
jgi:uncharacterized damage-inducible protein DinB